MNYNIFKSWKLLAKQNIVNNVWMVEISVLIKGDHCVGDCLFVCIIFGDFHVNSWLSFSITKQEVLLLFIFKAIICFVQFNMRKISFDLNYVLSF
jgi:hypothetical protein